MAENIDIQGSLVIVGGGMGRENKEICSKFIELAKDYRGSSIEEIKIGILPAGSIEPVKSAESYKEDFSLCGVNPEKIEIIEIAMTDDETTEDTDESLWKDNAYREDICEKIKDYDAIWFVGGEQQRYTETLLDKDKKRTPALEAIWEIYIKGAVLGGTSAGAAIMSNPMIGGGSSLSALSYSAVYEETQDEERLLIIEGLGFFTCGMVDQHFSQRGRLGRLIIATLETGAKEGFGIDEDTAMVVDNKNKTIRVTGSGGITIVNLSEIIKKEDTGEVRNILVSYIEKGDKYNLKTGSYEPAEKELLQPGEYSEICYAEGDFFENIKDNLTVKLPQKNVKEVTGITFELKTDDLLKGFLITFRKGEDTKLYSGDESIALINVHMDIKPVVAEIISF